MIYSVEHMLEANDFCWLPFSLLTIHIYSVYSICFMTIKIYSVYSICFMTKRFIAVINILHITERESRVTAHIRIYSNNFWSIHTQKHREIYSFKGTFSQINWINRRHGDLDIGQTYILKVDYIRFCNISSVADPNKKKQ